MKELKIFDAAEEVMRLNDLQLVWQRKNGWKYLRKSLDELREYLKERDVSVIQERLMDG